MTKARFTPAGTRSLLKELGHQPNKQLGQNFLIDANILDKSLEMAEVNSSDTIVEVGPGLGCLSEALLGCGAKVYAVERDKALAEHLRTKHCENPDFNLLENDAVKHPCASLPEDTQDYKVVANLPYAISTPWLSALLEKDNLPECMVLMLQKEAGDRFCAQPGTKNFGAISIFLQASYENSANYKVSKHCFHPAPKVDSVLIKLSRKPSVKKIKKETRELIRNIFTQRRKQIGSLCRTFAADNKLDPWFEEFEQFDKSLKSRPEELPLELWFKLDDYIIKS